MTITYTRDVPDPPHNPSQDVGDMQANTNAIDDFLAIDHVPFGENPSGMHAKVRMPSQSSDPTTILGQLALYNILSGTGSELNLIRDGVAGTKIKLTTSRIGNVTSATTGINFLPGDVIIQWGFVDGTHGGDLHFNDGDTNTVNFPFAGYTSPAFFVLTQAAFTNLNPPSGTYSIAINRNLAGTGFVWKFITNSSAYTRFYWFVIGT